MPSSVVARSTRPTIEPRPGNTLTHLLSSAEARWVTRETVTRIKFPQTLSPFVAPAKKQAKQRSHTLIRVEPLSGRGVLSTSCRN